MAFLIICWLFYCTNKCSWKIGVSIKKIKEEEAVWAWKSLFSYKSLKNEEIYLILLLLKHQKNEALRRKLRRWRKHNFFRSSTPFWTAWNCDWVWMYQKLCVSSYTILIILENLPIYHFFLLKFIDFWSLKIKDEKIWNNPVIS